MNIIVPVFPKNNLEKELLWAKIGGQPFILFALKQLCKLQEARLFVFTDQERIIHYLQSLNIQYDFIHRDISHDLPEIFPPGTSVTLKCLFKSHKMSKDEDLILVDYRNPLIIPDLVRKGYREYVKSRKPVLLSATEVGDHPAQFDAYYRIIDIDVVSLLYDDDDYWFESFFEVVEGRLLSDEIRGKINLSAMAVSRPFYFDWKSYGIRFSGSSAIYMRTFDNFRPKMTLVQNACKGFTNATSPPSLYFLENMDSARRLVTSEHGQLAPDLQLAGTSFKSDANQFGCILIKSHYNSKMFLYINRDLLTTNMTLRLWPFSNCGLVNGAMKNDCVSEKSIERKKKIEMFGCTFLGPLCSFHVADNIDGYIVAILERTMEGSADYVEPLQVEEPLWAIDPVTKQRTNLLSGERILGRQDFPPVFRLDGAFVISKGKFFHEIGQMVQDGKAEMFSVDTSASIPVQSQIDLTKLELYERRVDYASAG